MRRRELLSRVLGVVLIVVPVVGFGSTAALARAPYATQVVLDSSSVKLTSTTGKVLWASVEMDRFSQRPVKEYPTSTDFYVYLYDKQGEEHDWQFAPPNSTFTYDASTASGTIAVSAAQMAPFGSVQLSYEPSGEPNVRSCSDGATIMTRDMTVSGTLSFDTRSTAWGQVGSTTSPITFTGDSTIEVDQGRVTASCGGYGKLPCRGGIGLDGPGSDHGGFFVTTNGPRQVHPHFFFFTTRSVGKNYDAQFETDVFLQKGTISLRTKHDGSELAVVHAGTTGLITGTARLASVGPPKKYHGCVGGESTNWPASYTNGANPLTIHLEIGGDFTSKNSADGAYISQDPTPKS